MAQWNMKTPEQLGAEAHKREIDQAYQNGFDTGIEYMFSEMQRYINCEPMSKEKRAGALKLHRWLAGQQEERKQ